MWTRSLRSLALRAIRRKTSCCIWGIHRPFFAAKPRFRFPHTRFEAMKRVIPVLIVLAAAIAAGVYDYPRLIKKPAPVNQLTLSGNIEAHESLVGFKVPGRIVDLPIEEGQQVEQGALLARLDDADYKQRVSVDEATVRVRESSLALTLAGTRQQEVKAAQQTMMDAEADLSQKKLDNERAQKLFARDE